MIIKAGPKGFGTHPLKKDATQSPKLAIARFGTYDFK